VTFWNANLLEPSARTYSRRTRVHFVRNVVSTVANLEYHEGELLTAKEQQYYIINRDERIRRPHE